jgi:hypothetical protein
MDPSDKPRDWTLDMAWVCAPIEITIGIEGSSFHTTITSSVIDIVVSIIGSQAAGNLLSDNVIDLEISLAAYPASKAPKKCSWVKWSKIGSLDFTIDRTNVAGERPLDWRGCVYDVKKCGNLIVAYGDNGVSVLNPIEKNFGLKTVSDIGLVCRTAVAGNEKEHYYIDKLNRLFKFSTDLPEKLDYSEFLGTLTNPVMSLDERLGLLYICDGTNGFVYSTVDKSFGKGPGTITGLGYQDGSIYLTASGSIIMPKFEIATDIYDMGSRKPKTINGVEVGTDLADKLQAKISTRTRNNRDFRETGWVSVNPSGIAYIQCYGHEFKIHLRSFIVEEFEIDYIKVFGTLHGFSQAEAY